MFRRSKLKFMVHLNFLKNLVFVDVERKMLQSCRRSRIDFFLYLAYVSDNSESSLHHKRPQSIYREPLGCCLTQSGKNHKNHEIKTFYRITLASQARRITIRYPEQWVIQWPIQQLWFCTLMMYYGKAETYVLPQFPPFSGIQCTPLIRVVFILSNGPPSVTLSLFHYFFLLLSLTSARVTTSRLYCITPLFQYITLFFQPLNLTPYQLTSTTTFIICHHLLLLPFLMWMLMEV